MKHDFSGLAVALATPFTPSGDVDLDAFRKLVRHVRDGGCDVLVPLGSTGEAATLLEHERDRIISACLEEAGDLPVVAGTGSNSTALVVTPYYNKPVVAGLIAHYEACAAAAPGLPMIVYNVPGRTGLNLTPAALARLWENPAVVAVKESSGNIAQIAEIARTLPKGKQLLSGDDGLALAVIACGGVGLVSVVGNVVPKETKRLIDAASEGDLSTAQSLQAKLLPLIDALFCESNPIPLKAALRLRGLGSDHVRLPLTRAETSTRARLTAVLAAFD
jgi:4-hydroxy-tetrahydrodipicolinate synthase